MTSSSPLAPLVVLVTGLVLASGCSASAGGPGTVSGPKLARSVSDQLTQTVGRKPDKVTCPELKAEKGAKATCRLTGDGKTYDTFVTVTSAEDGHVKFKIKVADAAS